MGSNVVLFDANCPVCRRVVRYLQNKDISKSLSFIPLDDPIAQDLCAPHPEYLKMNTVILIENQKRFWLRAKAVFRILWLIGGKMKWMGIFYLLPSFMIDPFYILFAKLRPKD
jgi:predicted DCC family thiol-disulfide oxidoreductase YuxK